LKAHKNKPVEPTGASARKAALTAITRVIRDGQSLAVARERLYSSLQQPRDRAFAMQLVQGVLRWRWKLDAILAQCMDKPLRNKEHEVRHVLYMALHEITALDTPEYAAVDEAVKLTRKLHKSWASKLVNAVLRQFIKRGDEIQQGLTEAERLSHPQWLQQRIRQDWPDDWLTILQNNNAIADTHLRVNRQRCSVDELQGLLQEASVSCRRHELDDDIIVIQSTNIMELPGYRQGWFSVQDAGAQLVPRILPLTANARVLDLCAAPGGKACHMLESTAGAIDLLAVDIDAGRLARIEENLERLQLRAAVMQADASTVGWYQGALFDHILLDAPCSATGVIRRHPDIKSLRQASDIAALVELQRNILVNAWQLLKPGGYLLYVTCSLLAEENSQQVTGFVAAHGDAEVQAVDADWGRSCGAGRQLLPGENDSDGFYYALLHKKR
jgi:16S rRNA (cytosine967-C5)-methyltransferase